MTYRTIAFYVILLALISMGIYWYVSRPTAQERVLREFFSEFRRSKYSQAEEYTCNNDFYEMAAESSVHDTNGSQYLIGDYFPPSQKGILQISIEVYVKRHIAKWSYTAMETSETGDEVHFAFDLAIRDFTGGNAFVSTHSGTVEGTAYMVLQNGEWKVQRFDFRLRSDDGLILERYLEMAH